MVSTRGVKFKFSEGEKVLCYEPDPTKAKVLYDSKVLELVISRDNRGRKVPEYLIHFFGWNSSWDRCVKEEFILPDTEENRQLQTKLAKQAALCLKGKRKGKLPPIIKETLAKKECEESTRQSSSTSSSESSDEDMEKTIEIQIPAELKEQLEEDWYYITQKDKVIKIPCEQNVISILEDYVRYLAAKLLCASPPKSTKNGKECIPQNVQAKLDLCKEVMDGIRIYFDFTLPHLLLYRQEKKQYYTIGTTCHPICKPKSDLSSSKVNSTDMDSEVVLSTAQKDSGITIQGGTRVSLRNQASLQKSPVIPGEENGVSGNASKQRASSRTQYTKDSPDSSNLKRKKQKPVGPRRILRSADKQKVTDDSPNTSGVSSSATAEFEDEYASPTRAESPTVPNSPSRQTRRSIQSSVQYSSSTSSNRSPPAQRKISSPAAATSTSTQPSVTLHQQLTISVSNVSSSASSTHSSLSSPLTERHSYQLLNNSGMLIDILSWQMLPAYLYEQVPASPSLIYGAPHLLRLFVKLPELIYKMNMPQRKLTPLLDSLENFLQYLTENKDQIFSSTAYIDAGEETTDSSITSHIS